MSFTPAGTQLIVTEKGTGLLDIFNVLASGQTDGPLSEPSRGKTPFGFAFGPGGSVVVSEAEGGLPLLATASSYRLTGDDVPQPVSPKIADHNTAACWVVVTGEVAWVVNTASAAISSYHIGNDASITLVNPVAASTGTAVPIDAAASVITDYAPCTRNVIALRAVNILWRLFHSIDQATATACTQSRTMLQRR